MTHRHRLDLVSSQAPIPTNPILPHGSSCLTQPSLSACCRIRQTLLAQLAKARQYKIGLRRCQVALFAALRSAAIRAWLPAFVCWASFDLLVQARYLATPDAQHKAASFLCTRQKTSRPSDCRQSLRSQWLRLIERLINGFFVRLNFFAFTINKPTP